MVHLLIEGRRRSPIVLATDCEWRRMSAHLISAISSSTRDCDGCPFADPQRTLGHCSERSGGQCQMPFGLRDGQPWPMRSKNRNRRSADGTNAFGVALKE